MHPLFSLSPGRLWRGIRIGLRLGLLGLMIPVPAKAYVLEGPRWADNTKVRMYLQLGSPGSTLLDGSTSWDQVAQAALDIWNPYVGSGVKFQAGTGTVANTAGDRLNSVFFSSTIFGQSFGSDTLAVTQYYYSTNRTSSAQTFTEADVVVNSSAKFNSYRGDLRSGTVDLRRVLLHEFGHALGLGHVSQNAVAIMTPSTTNLDALQADDIAGVQSLYGTTHPAFFSGEVSVGSGVYYLSFSNDNLFGYYTYLNDPHFIYHYDLGYEYWFDAADGQGGIYFYDFASDDYFYTSPTFPFPYLYDFNLKAFLYYYPDTAKAGHYTTNPRSFYNFATDKFITR